MKYIKLFEEFGGSHENSLELIESLNKYKELIEENRSHSDTREYFDILSRISEHMVEYRDIFEYVLRTRFDSDSDRLYTIVRDLRSLFLDLGSESLSEDSKGLIGEITEVLHRYSHMIEKVIDIHNYYSRSGDMEAMSRGMREESEMLEGIMQSHGRLERLWIDLLMSFDSVKKFEEKRDVLSFIINLLVESDEKIRGSRFEDLSKKVLDILGDIIEALNGNVLGKRGGVGEIGRISEYYYELENSERLMLEQLPEIYAYLSNGTGE